MDNTFLKSVTLTYNLRSCNSWFGTANSTRHDTASIGVPAQDLTDTPVGYSQLSTEG